MMEPLDAFVQAVLDDPETPEHYVTVNDETALRAVLRRHLTALMAQTRAQWEREAASIPEPDNHHNAAFCPYCSPQMRERVARVKAAALAEALADLDGGIRTPGHPMFALGATATSVRTWLRDLGAR